VWCSVVHSCVRVCSNANRSKRIRREVQRLASAPWLIGAGAGRKRGAGKAGPMADWREFCNRRYWASDYYVDVYGGLCGISRGY